MMLIVLQQTYQDFFQKLDDATVAKDFLEQLVIHGYRIDALPALQDVKNLADDVAIEMSKKAFPTFYLHECPPPNGYLH
jgi:hypothetical protein